MSYILDALRKADAQRERDPARGIHAQPLQGSDALPARSRPLVWAGGAVGVAVIAAGTWYALRGPASPAPAAQVAQASPSVAGASPVPAPAQPAGESVPVKPLPAFIPSAPPAFAPAVAPATAAAMQASPEPAVMEDGVSPRHQRAIRTAQVQPAPQAFPQPAAPATPSQPFLPQAAQASSNPQTAAVPASPLAGSQPPMPLPQTAAPVPAPGTAGMVNVPAPGMTPPTGTGQRAMPFPPAPPAAPRAPVPPAPPTPPVAGLPGDAPKLTITGGVYSAEKSQRMLIVNGQVAKEGADLGSGMRLEEIQPKAAVLTFRGTRYVVGY